MLNDLKRIPLLLPFIVVFTLLWVMVTKLPLLLIGFWWCERCGKRFNFRAEKFEDTACGYDGCYTIDVHCKECEEKESGEK